MRDLPQLLIVFIGSAVAAAVAVAVAHWARHRHQPRHRRFTIPGDPGGWTPDALDELMLMAVPSYPPGREPAEHYTELGGWAGEHAAALALPAVETSEMAMLTAMVEALVYRNGIDQRADTIRGNIAALLGSTP